jgi:hypothetical protein
MSLETARKVLEIEAKALSDLVARFDAGFERAVELPRLECLSLIAPGIGAHEAQPSPN